MRVASRRAEGSVRVRCPKVSRKALFGLVAALVLAAPLAAQNEGDTNPWSRHRRIASIGFAATWAATAVGSAAMGDEYKSTTMIPVVGPLITLIRIESDPAVGYQPGGKPLLIASSITQFGFLTYYVYAWLNESADQSSSRFTVGWNGSSLVAGVRLPMLSRP